MTQETLQNIFQWLLQNEWFSRLGGGLFHSLWQIAVLAIIYQSGRWLIPQKQVNFRYNFGYFLLILMLVIPVGTVIFGKTGKTEKMGENPGSQAVSEVVFQISGQPELPSLPDQWNHLPDQLPDQQNQLSNPPNVASMEEIIKEALALQFSGSEEMAVEEIETGEMEAIPTPQKVPATWNITWNIIRNVTNPGNILLPIVSVCWLLGVIVLSTRLCAGILGIRKLKRSGVKFLTNDWDVRLAALCERMNVRKTVRLLGSKLVDSPVLIGVLRPVVLVPMSFLSGFTPEEVEAILVHELAHVRRHDYLANLGQMLIETLLFYHPLLWWVSRMVREDREYICDDFAVQQGGTAPLVYARTLANLEQFRQNGGKPMKRALFTPAAAAKPLLNRVRRVLGLKKESETCCGWLAGLMILAFLLATPMALVLWNNHRAAAEEQVEQTPVTADGPFVVSAPAKAVDPFVMGAPAKVVEQQFVMSGPVEVTPALANPQPAGNAPLVMFDPATSTAPPQQPLSPLFVASPQQQAAPGQPVQQLQVLRSTSLPQAESKPTEPIRSKLYSYSAMLTLFGAEDFHRYLQSRLAMEAFDGRWQIFLTQKNALIVSGPEEVHKVMAGIMEDLSDMIQENAELDATDETRIEVYTLKNPSTAQVLGNLDFDPMMRIAYDSSGKKIVVTAKPATHEIIAKLLEQLDVDNNPPGESSDAEDRVEVYTLKHASAINMGRTITQLEFDRAMTIVPDMNGNNKLVISAKPTTHAIIAKLLEQLDFAAPQQPGMMQSGEMSRIPAQPEML